MAQSLRVVSVLQGTQEAADLKSAVAEMNANAADAPAEAKRTMGAWHSKPTAKPSAGAAAAAPASYEEEQAARAAAAKAERVARRKAKQAKKKPAVDYGAID